MAEPTAAASVASQKATSKHPEQPTPMVDAEGNAMLTRLQSVPHLHMGEGFIDALREWRKKADEAGTRELASLLGFAIEVAVEAKVAHHLLDMIEGPAPSMYGHLDTRVWRVYKRGVVQRLDRIAEAHHKQVDESGGTYGDCNECGWSWPCPTYAWATTERDRALDPWDPSDDEADTPHKAASDEPANGSSEAGEPRD